MVKVSREEYVEKEMNNFKKYYEVEPFDDFSLKTLFNLQFDFIKCQTDHVKNRSEILKMIESIKASLKLKPVQQELDKNNKKLTYIFVKNDGQADHMHHTLVNDLKDITKSMSSRTNREIHTKTTIYKIAVKNENLRGLRFQDYWNLTGDTNFENEVIRPCLR